MSPIGLPPIEKDGQKKKKDHSCRLQRQKLILSKGLMIHKQNRERDGEIPLSEFFPYGNIFSTFRVHFKNCCVPVYMMCVNMSMSYVHICMHEWGHACTCHGSAHGGQRIQS